jgi:thiol-disulfide isomerase/thioredoxin
MRRALLFFGLPLMIHAQSNLIDSVRALLRTGQRSEAKQIVTAQKARNKSASAEVLAAESWLARDLLAQKKYEEALDLATDVRKSAEAQASVVQMDADPYLPTAIGAGIEVQSQSLHGLQRTSESVALLQAALKQYPASSIRTRLYKNLNLISLVGKSALPVRGKLLIHSGRPQNATPSADHLKRSAYSGRPLVVWFWAHWCGDCKEQAPILAELRRRRPDLKVLGVTKLFGYAAGGEDAQPAAESAYIRRIYQDFYAPQLPMEVILDLDTFRRYGASTTPTLVMVDRQGVVRTYHPGKMSLAELEAAAKGL